MFPLASRGFFLLNKGSKIFVPLGHGYAWLQRIRAIVYEQGWWSTWRPPVPCISVGNINWGGRGKTPLAAYLLQWSVRRGLFPVLLSRGYRSAPPFLPFLVSPQSPVHQAGDEPIVLARSCPQAKVVIDPKRVRSAAWAWQHFKPDLYILDDGFQHLALQRDIDLVLLNQADLEQGWNKVIPAGTWREGVQALNRASAFVISLSDTESLPHVLPQAKRRLADFCKPLFAFTLEPRGLFRLSDWQPVTPDPKRPYVLFSGLGNPQAFLQTASSFFAHPPRDQLTFPDHHNYTSKDLQQVYTVYQSNGRPLLVCTTKDAVKLMCYMGKYSNTGVGRQFQHILKEMVCLDVGVQFCPTRINFDHWLQQKVSWGR